MTKLSPDDRLLAMGGPAHPSRPRLAFSFKKHIVRMPTLCAACITFLMQLLITTVRE